MRSRSDSRLTTPTRNVIRGRQMPVSIDDEERACDLLCEWVTYIQTHREVRSEVRPPWSGVVEIVFGVERIVPDNTAKDSALDRQPFADRREIRNIRWSLLTEDL